MAEKERPDENASDHQTYPEETRVRHGSGGGGDEEGHSAGGGSDSGVYAIVQPVRKGHSSGIALVHLHFVHFNLTSLSGRRFS